MGVIFMQKHMIQTKRLGFRFLQKTDIDYLVGLNNDPDVRQFFPDGVQNREQTEVTWFNRCTHPVKIQNLTWEKNCEKRVFKRVQARRYQSCS